MRQAFCCAQEFLKVWESLKDLELLRKKPAKIIKTFLHIKIENCQTIWCISIILASGRLNQEEANCGQPGYTLTCLKIQNKTKP